MTSIDEKVLLQPYHYIRECNGRKLVTELLEAFNHWLKVPDARVKTITELVALLDNASLLVDDIEDNANHRNGITAAHMLFGTASTINSANYVYFLALEKTVKELPNDFVLKTVNIFMEQILELHRGQGWDLWWRDSHYCPTEEQYLEMVRRKCGGLVAMGVKLMQVFSADQRDYCPLVDHLVTYFQLKSDFECLKCDERDNSFCDAVSEGKFTFAVVHALQTQPKDTTLMNILRKRSKSVELKAYVVEKLASFGSIDYTLKRMNDFHSLITTEIEALGDNPCLKQLL